MQTSRLVLVIDDETEVVDTLKRSLTKNGYDVICAHNGLEGLEQLRLSQPQLILLDINMPRMSGIEFYRHICSTDNKPLVPVIVVTAFSQLSDMFRELEVDGFIAKPCGVRDILAEVDTVFRKRYAYLMPPVQPVPGTGSPKVLVAEDDNDSSRALEVKFRAAGYDVVLVSNGREAIEEIMTKPLVDFIVLKLILPDIAGDEIAYRLKRLPRTMDVPIVFYTLNNPMLDHIVMRRVCDRSGVKNLVESAEPQDVVNEVEKIRQGKIIRKQEL